MTIHLPPEIENSIQDAVHRGHFGSVDDAMTEAASLLLQRLEQNPPRAKPPAASPTAPTHKPIWEEIEELTARIPEEEFLKLPVDGAEQHDHYIYGLPRRPSSQ